ncbi:hypothetical protein GCM10010435_44360 [Winogradskya consettensis]|uniref:Rhamnogalacturonase A/B/Epimerase-like pectate lyase domain-containing protein n=1 Tax=Winogradskya consettensis TaxID=113560 RepID=A0A919T1B2_9ACTN|nr:glycosyl hydrolase family 28-related protein [Actinoplanes consettensis]GIM82684.1 hypothetical protein Aco04nite_82750 [Actinoplanes consettensis]
MALRQLPAIVGGTIGQSFVDLAEVVKKGDLFFWNVKDHGVKGDDSTDDTVALKAAIAASPPASTIVFPPGVYLVNTYIPIPAGRHVLGLGYSKASGAVIKQKNGANITTPAGAVGLFVPPAWVANSTTCDGQILIENMAFDGNRANNPLSTASGIILMNFWSQIKDCYIYDMPRNSVLLTDVGRDDVTVITNTASENKITTTKMNGCGHTGVKQISRSLNSNLDGLMRDCEISYMDQNAIAFDKGSGWTFDNTHTYGIVGTAISVSGCFATKILNSYIEDFGGEGTDGTYYSGIEVSCLDGRGSTIRGNIITGKEEGLSSVYHYIRVNANTGQMNAEAIVADNMLRGLNTDRGTGIVVQHSSGGKMTVTGNDGNIQNIHTKRYVAGGDSFPIDPRDAIVATARKYKTGNQAVTSGDVVAVTLGTTQYNRDPDVFDMETADVIKVLKPGVYTASSSLNFVGGTTGDRTGILTVNGAVVKEFGLAGTDSRPAAAEDLVLAANDTVGLSVYTVGGTSINGSASKDVTLTLTRVGN